MIVGLKGDHAGKAVSMVPALTGAWYQRSLFPGGAGRGRSWIGQSRQSQEGRARQGVLSLRHGAAMIGFLGLANNTQDAQFSLNFK